MDKNTNRPVNIQNEREHTKTDTWTPDLENEIMKCDFIRQKPFRFGCTQHGILS